ncbi:MAG: penicillin-binding protein [Sphingobacterium sp.]|jgi:hypothetical protein|nr:penicillin-binding protein [Sphingobacterium sp.]
MTRSNLHITLSDSTRIKCVLDGSSAPEQEYIVEVILLPLLALNNPKWELSLIRKHCEMDEQRTNASYRYTINLVTKEVRMFEEHYNYSTDIFRRGKEITGRYTTYLKSLKIQGNEKRS